MRLCVRRTACSRANEVISCRPASVIWFNRSSASTRMSSSRSSSSARSRSVMSSPMMVTFSTRPSSLQKTVLFQPMVRRRPSRVTISLREWAGNTPVSTVCRKMRRALPRTSSGRKSSNQFRPIASVRAHPVRSRRKSLQSRMPPSRSSMTPISDIFSRTARNRRSDWRSRSSDWRRSVTSRAIPS